MEVPPRPGSLLSIQFVFSSVVDSAAVRLDDCTFHESVDLSSFEATQTLVVSPPEGEVQNWVYKYLQIVIQLVPANVNSSISNFPLFQTHLPFSYLFSAISNSRYFSFALRVRDSGFNCIVILLPQRSASFFLFFSSTFLLNFSYTNRRTLVLVKSYIQMFSFPCSLLWWNTIFPKPRNQPCPSH